MPAHGDAALVAATLRLLTAHTEVSGAAHAVDGRGRAADSAAADTAATAALAAVGVGVAGPLGRHDDGRPRWPVGVTGSMAHAGTVAVAVAASGDAPDQAIGVDVELAAALPAADAAGVLDASERAAVAAHPAPDAHATLLWAAKEAAFKAWNTGTGGALVGVDPVDIHIEVAPGAGADGRWAFTATAGGRLASMAAPVGALHGWWAQAGDYVVVVAFAAARASARGPHHGLDGSASAPTTSPSAAKATR